MFFDANRILFMRQMILAKDLEERKEALKNLNHSKKMILKVFLKLWNPDP